jgi:hypothetical protein
MLKDITVFNSQTYMFLIVIFAHIQIVLLHDSLSWPYFYCIYVLGQRQNAGLPINFETLLMLCWKDVYAQRRQSL